MRSRPSVPEETPPTAPPAAPSERPFGPRLLLVAVALVTLAAAWRLSDVLVLAFAAILLAFVLHGLARTLRRASGLPEAWAVAPVVIILAAALGGIFWLFGSQLATQFRLLAQDLPQSVAQLLHDLAGRPWGAFLLDQAREFYLAGATGQIAARVGALFTSALRALAYAAIVLFAAIYLAAQPERYRSGLLCLVPAARRKRLGGVLDLAGMTLQRWIIGQCITMAAVGTLTGVGLGLLGIDAPLALGLVAGLFAFVPYVGPVLASAPGILMAATQGPLPALYAALVYAAVHVVEGNLVTPLVQAEVVRLPPVVTIFATLAFGLLLGPFGVLLAAPLTVVLLVAVNTLYIEDVLGERRVWPAPR